MKIAITTLGCKVNQADSAFMKGTLKNHGYEIVSPQEKADICIVNTCTVTAKSDYQSRQMIRRAIRSGATVIATGCYAQLKHRELSEIKGLDLIIGNSEKQRIHEYIEKISSKDNKLENCVNNIDAPVITGSYYSDRSRAFLKIQDGCNFSCSYCAVPAARGKSRSLPLNDVISTAKDFTLKGYREIVLTGVHIGSYGLDLLPPCSLLDAVKDISHVCPETRIRLSSIEPHEFMIEVLDFIKKGFVCPHLHIPLQSGSDRILNLMKRGYSTKFFRELIYEIISHIPGIAIGTDIITGFPGEGKDEFISTVSMIEELPFSYLHVFPYSPRPNTPAAEMDKQVPNKLKKERISLLLQLVKKKKYDYISRNLNKYIDVIVEGKTLTSGFFRAISSNYLKVLVKENGLEKGQRLMVKAVEFVNGELICIPA
jgi:threonylcarbamoyladenosine tRNA methylthiotransferase MtaB